MAEPITRDEFHHGLEGVRHEFRSEITAAGVQIGAVEAILTEKLKGVKLWCAAALVGGQVVAGLVAAFVGPQRAAQGASSALHAAARLVGLI